jgi:hypothetical protein
MREGDATAVLSRAFKQVNKGLLGRGEGREFVDVEKVGGAVVFGDLFAA